MASRAAATVLVLAALICAAQSTISAADAGGLSRGFHAASCPGLEKIVGDLVAETFRRDVGVAPALIRILFHDCFPQGCDASVLLTGNNSELNAVPNQTLRPVALDLIERIRAAVHAACGPTVSCADITVLATRDALVQAGGPHFDVALGRRDGLAPASQDLVDTLPAPSFDVPTLISSFGNRNLDVADLVSLSGAHTFGIAHCPVFSDRFAPNIDLNPLIDPLFARRLRAKCQGRAPGHRQPDPRRAHSGRVRQQFAMSMVKMSNMDLLTGTQGEIRQNCAVPNRRVEGIETANDEGHAAAM
ncbi:hypothetical protein ZWY2020_011579 [Hordeum vulgare]|nr:hypothetical protein ZWY2020_011579 [Hordeum vulgare]